MVVCGVLNVFVCVCELLCGGVWWWCLCVFCVFACDVKHVVVCLVRDLECDVVWIVIMCCLCVCVCCCF